VSCGGEERAKVVPLGLLWAEDGEIIYLFPEGKSIIRRRRASPHYSYKKGNNPVKNITGYRFQNGGD